MKPLLAAACALALLFPTSCCTTPQPPTPSCEYLTISGLIDGSEKFIFSQGGVKWTHLHWSEPDDMTFNGKPWNNPRKTPAQWRNYAALDLAHATIVKRKGRDLVALEPSPDGFILYFDGSPNGASTYSVTIAIPKHAKRK